MDSSEGRSKGVESQQLSLLQPPAVKEVQSKKKIALSTSLTRKCQGAGQEDLLARIRFY